MRRAYRYLRLIALLRHCDRGQVVARRVLDSGLQAREVGAFGRILMERSRRSSMPTEVIDLCTPPPSPVRVAEEDDGEVQMVDREHFESARKRRKAADSSKSTKENGKKAGRRGKLAAEADAAAAAAAAAAAEAPAEDPDIVAEVGEQQGEGSESEMEVAGPAALRDTGEAEDADGITFMGRTGDFALQDFPHSREYCAVHPFRKGNEKKARNHRPHFACLPPSPHPPLLPRSVATIATATSATFRLRAARSGLNTASPPTASTNGGG